MIAVFVGLNSNRVSRSLQSDTDSILKHVFGLPDDGRSAREVMPLVSIKCGTGSFRNTVRFGGLRRRKTSRI